MKTKPIKREFRDLSIEDMENKKNQIADFVFDYPDVANVKQGYVTIDVLHDLIEYKRSDDRFGENVIKALFF